jgi:hypothetical protein
MVITENNANVNELMWGFLPPLVGSIADGVIYFDSPEELLEDVNNKFGEDASEEALAVLHERLQERIQDLYAQIELVELHQLLVEEVQNRFEGNKNA